MATVARRLLRAARNASLPSRTPSGAASRAAAMASRSSRTGAAAAAARSARAAAAAAAARSGVIAPLESFSTRGDASTEPRDDAPRRKYFSSADFEHLPDDAKSPTDKDLESDAAVWALYERWCKAFNKERDHAEMARRFKIFRHYARKVHHWNTYLPSDPEEAAIYLQKREEAKLLLSKGEDVSNFEDWHLPMELGPFADGGDPFVRERLLKELEAEDVTAE